jgi:peptide/nickel transport system substrate-binding protein
LLEESYLSDPGSFATLSYWAEPPLGVGAYRVQEWIRGRHVLLEANPRYVLGRPKIDAIEARFIPDLNTMVANLLAGEIELTLGKSITLDQALQIRSRWDGRIEVQPVNPNQVYPQMHEPDPPVVADPRFRRAMLHALNRQDMVDTLMGGLTTITHSYLDPAEPPEYHAIAGPRVVKYEYDARRAAQIIEGIGYARRPDGAFADPTGQPLSLQLRGRPSGIVQTLLPIVADDWKRVGVTVEQSYTTDAQAADRTYRAAYPAFEIARNAANTAQLRAHVSSQAPLPENNYVGNNRIRYMNPEFDSLIGRFFTTIPINERARILGDIIHHMTDQVLTMPLAYDVEPVAIGPRLVNVKLGDHSGSWTAHAWDVK